MSLSSNPHGRTLKTGILLVNLGTPDAPETGPVRRYLAEFLADPRVVEQPRWLWWLILHGIILRVRPRRSAAAYRKVWTDRGSPLLVHCQDLCQTLQAALPAGLVRVELAMRYGQPSMQAALGRLQDQAIDRLLVVPLYPQYSATTTASVLDELWRQLASWRWVPELRVVSSYHDHPAYIAALCESISNHWQRQGRGQKLLFSFHGIPTRYVRAGDPYYCHSQKTARLVAEQLGLQPEQWQVSFQSRVGREPWLPPYTDETLEALPAQGVRKLDVVCPGFSVDCLETLEEIAMEGAEIFSEAGGESLSYIPALNAEAGQLALMQALLSEHGHGWPGVDQQAAVRIAGGDAEPEFPA